MAEIIYKELSYKVQGVFFEIYKILGNGFKETIYHNALIEESKRLGLKIDSQKRIRVYYKSKIVGVYIPDIIVDEKILIEVKCKPNLLANDIKQFWDYLKGSDYKVGYLVNFGSYSKVEFIRRVYDSARKVSAT